MESKCKNCKFFKVHNEKYYESENIYTGERTIDVGDFRVEQPNWKNTHFINEKVFNYGSCECRRIDCDGWHVDKGGNAVLDSDILLVKSEEDRHYLLVGEEFGCIHFEKYEI